ncbi:Serine/threonine protein kinase PrkC, regulator of stationary phase [Rubrivivax sp. A210]|uniref:serine/threonine-protein kinase n=1 Tax=Rubrivivax sp. A210 TaxID=2772301 RepID=UPI0019197305|nr:serine/threonine-protein kinase [Rubrivivax sp. A210]CAD5373197.1 Serine/threonine protein kinase PrkC, regulator of stationary phase [Rubrivivax sp. A210]
MHAPLAEHFGDYRLQRVLGEGASAIVYLAQDRRNQGWVALKVLAPHSGGHGPARDATRELFLKEAATARTLQHPDIVAVLDAGETEGRLWLAMEAVPGTSLQRYAKAQRLLPLPLVARIAERIARALAHAHGHGIVHRDLKPANVMVDWPSDTLKLADLGLARRDDAAPTATGLMLGTPAYMAPEQLAGNPPTPATDLYALGALLYQLVAGRLPHEAPTMGELLRQVAREPVLDLRLLKPGTPPALAALIGRLLAKRPQDRPASAATAADELAAIQPLLSNAPTR